MAVATFRLSGLFRRLALDQSQPKLAYKGFFGSRSICHWFRSDPCRSIWPPLTVDVDLVDSHPQESRLFWRASLILRPGRFATGFVPIRADQIWLPLTVDVDLVDSHLQESRLFWRARLILTPGRFGAGLVPIRAGQISPVWKGVGGGAYVFRGHIWWTRTWRTAPSLSCIHFIPCTRVK